MRTKLIAAYIDNVEASNHSTARTYNEHFESFSLRKFKIRVDNLVKEIKQTHRGPYEVLSAFIQYLQQFHNLSPISLKQHVIAAKNFLGYYDVDISPRKFKLKVNMPKVVRKNKQALSKSDVIDILNSCADIRLNLLHAS